MMPFIHVMVLQGTGEFSLCTWSADGMQFIDGIKRMFPAGVQCCKFNKDERELLVLDGDGEIRFLFVNYIFMPKLINGGYFQHFGPTVLTDIVKVEGRSHIICPRTYPTISICRFWICDRADNHHINQTI